MEDGPNFCGHLRISELYEYVHFSKAFKGHKNKNKNVPLGNISTHCEIRTAQQCNCLPRPSGLE